LADARFFFDQDRKYPLLSRFSQLEKIVYHHQLGSQADRTKRVQKIVVVLIEHLIQTQNKQDNTISLRSVSVDQDQLLSLTDQAALLSKCDLTTCMVDEFPELQGTMGKYYAEYEGLPTEVSQAIEDHYKPRFAGDLLPHNPVTMLLAFADKLEILVGMFGIGHFPTGERDPFALRRHALGIIRILMETPLSIVLPVLLDKVSKIFGNLIKPEYITHNLSDFIYERLSGRLREEGFTTNQINAVLSLRPTDITQVVRRLEAIRIFTDMSQAPALIAANKRIVNILKKADKNGLKIDQSIIEPLLYEPAEQNLYKTLCQVAEQVQVTVNQQDYIHTFRVLANLETPIDHFFQEVMVNCEDSQLRTNRFALLHHLHQSMNQVADISRLID
jgi:glycyl-tRNA synthetase beta chain